MRTNNYWLHDIIRALPPYLNNDEESNRLYFMMTRDITGKWLVSYETEGRHYYAHTAGSPEEAIIALLSELGIPAPMNDIKSLKEGS